MTDGPEQHGIVLIIPVGNIGLGLRVSQVENLGGIQDASVTSPSDSSISGLSRNEILDEISREIRAAESRLSVKHDSELEAMAKAIVARFEQRLEEAIKPITETLDMVRIRFAGALLDKMKRLETDMSTSKTMSSQMAEDLRKLQIDSLTLRASGGSNILGLNSPPTHASLVGEQIDQAIEVFAARLDKFERDLRQDGVRFGGLGIGSFTEMHAWVTTHLDDNKFGCFVDGVSILQFLNSVYISPSNELKNMESVEKLGMVSGQEAKVITSFQNVLPVVFGGDDDVSKPLPALATPEKWYDGRYGTGLKDQIRKGMVGIKVQFEAQIRLMRHEQGRMLALSCLSNSELFIAGLAEYISNVYDELKHGGYDSKGAWILTCKLVRRIFDQIYNVRASAKDAKFRGADSTTSAMVLFATLKAHDVMREFVDANFENHPSIASEYVKFLTRNSMAGSIGDVVSEVAKMGDKLVLMESGRVTLKKSFDSLQTRVVALEKPKK